MKISENMRNALNEQINAELYSAYLYLSMAAWLDKESHKGMANWEKEQAKEEVEHAMKLYDYIIEQEGIVTMKSIASPKLMWDSPLEIFEDGLAHEKKVTSLINDLVQVAKDENDSKTEEFLQWFVDEQVEEEEHAVSVIEKIKTMDLKEVDKVLGERHG